MSPGDRTRPVDELIDAVREAGAYEAIASLPDYFSTLLTDDDDRLKGDALFRLGIARALLSQASIVVANEPAEKNGATAGETIDALRAIARRGSIVFVQPKRSNTLRQVDQVVLLHEKKVVAVGTHNELLEKSELYRHLNYILFSPLRNVVVRISLRTFADRPVPVEAVTSVGSLKRGVCSRSDVGCRSACRLPLVR